jgi:hypothetical protein
VLDYRLFNLYTCITNTKLLQLRPCKETAVRALKEHDPMARIRFGNQIRKSVHDAEVDPHLVFFSDKACFPLP